MKNLDAKFWKVAAVAAALLMFGCGPGFKVQIEDDEPLFGPDYIRIGDMAFHESELEEVRVSSQTGYKRNKSDPWKNGIIPVRFKFAVSASEREMFFDACSEWSKVANVRCIPHSGQEDRIDVSKKSDDGCVSQIGRGPGRFESATNMNLAPGCWSKGVIMHELGHAMGLLHEHQRADRDLHIKINVANIKDRKDAFERISNGRAMGPYDFDSIMHYGSNYFSKASDLNTIEPLPGTGVPIERLGSGQRTATLSRLDGEGLAAIYGPPLMMGVPATPPPSNPLAPVATPTPAPTPVPVAPAPPAGFRSQLLANQVMRPDERLYSSDGRSVFIYQNDGNLVLYRDQTPVWSSDTFSEPGNAVMQGDGNLVVYDKNGNALWASNTDNNPGALLNVQGDGNVVIYMNGNALWATDTNE